MKLKIVEILLLSVFIFFFTACNSQESDLVHRDPAVAGAFYSKNADKLKENLKDLFREAEKRKITKSVQAIIVPHAGYVYSGIVAASGFNQVDPQATYDNIFVIGSSHRTSFKGASIYHTGNYITPFGEAEVNTRLGKQLVDENDVLHHYRDAHLFEHSLEVQIPFIQYHFKEASPIIPIVIGSQDVETPQKLAEVLLPYFNEKNLFVISSDFSHYPDYEDAYYVDSLTLKSILMGDPKEFAYTLGSNDQKNIHNLATSCCGWTSVLTLLNLIEFSENMELEHIVYKNSGDVEMGDKKRVVGYHAIAVYKGDKKTGEVAPASEFNLTEAEKEDLLKLARKTVEEHVNTRKVSRLSSEDFSDQVHAECGAFVTLHKHGNLRGCIGRFTTNQPLYQVVQDMAIAASTEDYRFPPVSTEEVQELEIEISVLTPMQKIESINEIELGKHGIYIKKGFRSGTFLPQVATETGWTLDEYLGHCARDKAGIGWEGWKDADIFVYKAYVFSE